MKHTFVTVLHGEDRNLQCLQARSFARYLPRELVAEILLVENDPAGKTGLHSKELLREYGALAGLVRVVKATSIAEVPPQASGWFSQQILKLMVARLVSAERYVVLDAKNHLTFPVGLSFFSTGDKICSRWVSYQEHPLKAFFVNTLQYFGLDPQAYLHAFLPTTTPFTLPTRIARAVVADVENREKCRFPAAFLKCGLTEFFTVAAFIVASGWRLDEFYDFSSAPSPTLWEETAAQGTEAVAAVIARAERDAHPFFTVHRRAIRKLTSDGRENICAFWQRRHLCSFAEGMNFLDRNVRG